MRDFNYSLLANQKWDSEILGLVASIYKEQGKQELYLKRRPAELEKLVEIAKIQSTEASNAIEGIVTTNTRIRQLVEDKTTPRNRNEQEIAGYRDALSVIHESFDAIPITRNYIIQLHKIMYSHINNPMGGRLKNVQNYISATVSIQPRREEDVVKMSIFGDFRTTKKGFYKKDKVLIDKKSTTKKGKYFQKYGSKLWLISKSKMAILLNKNPQNAIL